ncbi:site-specific DNA-methyltransferase [Campylobacter upsaliensis]|nr:site-specific DNA-methyltransferase [Campylobacter upsaliensis]
MPTKQRLTKQHIKRAHIIDSTKEHNPLLDYLAKHHPQTISEERLNLDALSQALGFSPSSMQGYGLSFIGKPLANALYSTPTTKELKELDPKHSQNIIIKGDNLHALKLLKSAYDGKIKMIYIDPPYNTKNDKFIYNDNFIKEYQKLLIELDLLKLDSNGKMLEKSEVLHFLTNPSGDKAHSGWLSFMLPRLKLARDLLKDDGVIFISIDDNEQANLKILCDEIFGEENFISNLCVVDNLKGNNNTEGISQTNEYCLIYAKDKSSCRFGDLLVNDDEELEKWNLDEFGYWKEGRNIKGTGENAPREKRPSMFYPIYLNDKMEISLQKSDEFYIEVLPLTNGQEMCWNWGKEFLEKNKHELIVKKTENGFNFIKKQRPALGDLPSKKMKTTCYSPKYSTSVSSNIIKGLFNNKRVFDYSKSPFLIKDILKISTNTGGGGI